MTRKFLYSSDLQIRSAPKNAPVTAQPAIAYGLSNPTERQVAVVVTAPKEAPTWLRVFVVQLATAKNNSNILNRRKFFII